MLIVKITEEYTRKANPERGYHDYETIVEGNIGKLDTYFREVFDKCKRQSMWCSYKYEKLDVVTGRYTIHHGYDSGD